MADSNVKCNGCGRFLKWDAATETWPCEDCAREYDAPPPKYALAPPAAPQGSQLPGRGPRIDEVVEVFTEGQWRPAKVNAVYPDAFGWTVLPAGLPDGGSIGGATSVGNAAWRRTPPEGGSARGGAGRGAAPCAGPWASRFMRLLSVRGRLRCARPLRRLEGHPPERPTGRVCGHPFADGSFCNQSADDDHGHPSIPQSGDEKEGTDV